jgi:hypothetical protein
MMVVYADRISINCLINPTARRDIKILVAQILVSVIVFTRIRPGAVSGLGSKCGSKRSVDGSPLPVPYIVAMQEGKSVLYYH